MSLDFLALGDIWAAVLGSMLSCLCVREGVAASGVGGLVVAEGVEDTVTYCPASHFSTDDGKSQEEEAQFRGLQPGQDR